MADPPDEGDIDRLTVKVAVKVEQKYLEQGRSVVEHRAAAEARNPIMPLPRNPTPPRINPMFEPARGSELQVARRKPQPAPALAPMHPRGEDDPGRAQQFGPSDAPSRRKC